MGTRPGAAPAAILNLRIVRSRDSLFGALQGALLVKRTTNDLSQLNDVIAVMKLQLAARSQV